jgi:hypothetical protein
MANKVVLFRRGDTKQTNLFVGAPGEITVDTDKWTAVIHDGHTFGGHPLRVDAQEFPRVRYLNFRAAAVQQGVASLGFSSPLNAGPLPVVITDETTGVIVGAAAFDPDSNQSIQDHFLLPVDWVSPVTLDIVWRADATIGTAIWLFESCFVPLGEILAGNSFGIQQEVSTVVSGIPNTLTTSTININTDGFAPSGELFFKLTRASGADSINRPVELLSLRFAIHIQEK